MIDDDTQGGIRATVMSSIRKLGTAGAILVAVVGIVWGSYTLLLEPRFERLEFRLDSCEERVGRCNEFLRDLVEVKTSAPAELTSRQ